MEALDLMQTGGQLLNHGLNDCQEMEMMYADWLDECERTGIKFTDPDFAYEDTRNFGRGRGSVKGEKDKYCRLPKGAEFVVDGIDAVDVTQGRVGDCWFLSSIAALAQKRKFIKRVLMPQYNNQPEAIAAGIYRFRFYRMGEWMDIIIDDQLPKKYHAKAKNNEYWVPLVEKACAKFFGSYKMIQGGEPCWALCNLTGGITISIANVNPETAKKIEKEKRFDLFEWIYANVENAVFCSSNTDTDDDTEKIKGLVPGHAYSLLAAEKAKLKNGSIAELVQIRNPWGKMEWNGDWSDKSSKWNDLAETERKRFDTSNDNDGSFWMSFNDWMREFETLDICYLPNERSAKNHRVIGDFRPGKNSPRDLAELQSSFMEPKKSHQIVLEVKKEEQTVLLQYLLNCSVREPHYLTLNMFKDPKPRAFEYEKDQLKSSTRIEPIFPAKSGYQIEYYKHNGYIFHLKPGRYIIVISAAPKEHLRYKPTKFVLRAVGDNIGVQHLEGMEEQTERVNLATQQLRIAKQSIGEDPDEAQNRFRFKTSSPSISSWFN